jgi:hypothetical protein
MRTVNSLTTNQGTFMDINDFNSTLKFIVVISYRTARLDYSFNLEVLTKHLEEMIEGNTGANNEVASLCSKLLDLVHELETSDIVHDLAYFTNKIEDLFVSYPEISDNIIDVLESDTKENMKERLLSDIKSYTAIGRHNQIAELLRNAKYQIDNNKVPACNMGTYLADLMIQIETITSSITSEDSAVTTTVDFDNLDDLEGLFEASEKLSGECLYKTGYSDLNVALQGGFRLTDNVMVGALTGSYKTSLCLQLGDAIVTINEPVIRYEGKQPALVRVSLEDPLASNVEFMFNDLFFSEHSRPPSLKERGLAKDRATYVKNQLGSKGWSIHMSRVNPSDWTYRHLLDYVETYEQTYNKDVQVLIPDYLAMIPTTGCITTGAQGTDLRDMLRRVRNWGSNRETMVINPHQLNTSVASLAKDKAPSELLNAIKGLGQHAGCSQLLQELDVSILLHKLTHDNNTYINLCVDKHRHQSAIPDSLKMLFFKFTEDGMPLYQDVIGGKKRVSTKRLPMVNIDMANDF